MSRAIVLQLAVVIIYHNLNVTAVLRLTSAHRSDTTCELERVLDGMDSVESDVGIFAPLGSIARNYIQHQRVSQGTFSLPHQLRICLIRSFDVTVTTYQIPDECGYGG